MTTAVLPHVHLIEERPGLWAGIKNLITFRRDSLAVLRDLRQQTSRAARLRLGPLTYVMLFEPDDIGRVFLETERFTRQTRGFKALRMVLGHGLVTSEGEFWRRQRRIAQPAFARKRIASFANTMVDCTNTMLERWPDGGDLDIAEEMMAVTLRIIGLTMLSADIEREAALVREALPTVLHYAMEVTSNPFVFPGLPTPANYRFKKALGQLDDVIKPIITARRASAQRPDDLLTMLLEAVDLDTGESMNDLQLRDEVMTMFLAGHETTSNALSWTLMLLSQHPEIARRVQAELDGVLGERAMPSLEDLPKLPYLKAVLQESMRLYPPVWMVARYVAEPTEIGGHHLEAGDGVFVAPYVTHRDPRFWHNPSGFDPDRFLEEDPMRPKHAYFPFAAGPHQCIGSGFAMMEAQLILGAILRRYEVALRPEHPIALDPSITLRPKHGLRATVRRRMPLPASVTALG